LGIAHGYQFCRNRCRHRSHGDYRNGADPAPAQSGAARKFFAAHERGDGSADGELGVVRRNDTSRTPEKDETYRRELAEGCYDAEHHKELALGAFWEKIGTLVHFGLIEPEAFVDFAAAICPYHWHLLRDVVALRRTENVRIWERFEEFAGLCEANLPPRQPQGV